MPRRALVEDGDTADEGVIAVAAPTPRARRGEDAVLSPEDRSWSPECASLSPGDPSSMSIASVEGAALDATHDEDPPETTLGQESHGATLEVTRGDESHHPTLDDESEDATVETILEQGPHDADSSSGQERSSRQEGASPRWFLPAVVFASWLVSLVILYLQVRDVDFTLPMQNYDSATHNSLVRGMLNRGTISPFGFQDDIDLYGYRYPLGFTTAAYLFMGIFDVGIPTGISMAWALGAAVLWPLGCAFLVHAMVPDRVLPTALAPVVSMCFGQYPLGLLNFGTLYPYGLASSLLPWLMGVSVLFARGFFPRSNQQGVAAIGEGDAVEEGNASDMRPGDVAGSGVATVRKGSGAHENGRLNWRGFMQGFPWWQSLAATLLTLILAYTQPRVGLTYLLISGSFWAMWWYRRYWRNKRSRFIAKAWLPAMMLMVAGGALLYAYVRSGDRLFDTSQWNLTPAIMNWKHAIATYLSGASYANALGDLQLSWTIIALIGIAMIAVVCLCPDERWLLASWLFVGVVFCCAAAGQEILPRIVSLPWYRQELRIYAAYPVVMVPMVCVGFGALAVFLAREVGRFGQAVSALTVAACAVVTALFSPGVVAITDSIVATSSQPGGLLDEAKMRFYEECAPIVGDDLVAADPWAGAMFAYSQFNINQYFNTLGPQERHWEALLGMNAWGFAALRAYDVTYVMDLGPIWSDFDSAYASFWIFREESSYEGLEALLTVWDPYLEHNLTLYRIPSEA